MKTTQKIAGIIVIILVANHFSFSQGNTYKLDGNNNGTANSKLGFTNDADLIIVTRDTVRQTITREGNIIIENNLEVKGKIESGDIIVNGILKADSVNIPGVITITDTIVQFQQTVQVQGQIIVDSIRTNGPLQIGDSTFSFVPNYGIPPSDQIRSDNGRIAIGNGTTSNPPPNFSNILLGIGTQTPAFKLDVFDGDANVAGINATDFTRGYLINGKFVLRHFANSNTNIVLGTDAALNLTTGTNNTMAGYKSGENATTFTTNRNSFFGAYAGYTCDGFDNTCIGYRSGLRTGGQYNTTLGSRAGEYPLVYGGGTYNTLIGTDCGRNTSTGSNNTMIGYRAGFAVSTATNPGSNNCFFGISAGQDAIGTGTSPGGNVYIGWESGKTRTGNFNLAAGYESGKSNTGSYNVFMGYRAGYMGANGDNNVLIGEGASMTAAVSNSVALGADAKIGADKSVAIGKLSETVAPNTIILGDNTMRVGIGLSAATPSNNLEIRATDASGNSLPDESGLTFRNLTENSAPSLPNATNTVLSVNTGGKVILVPDRGFGAACASSTPFDLSDDFRIGLNNKNLFFEGSGTAFENAMSVGLPCATLPLGKFHVECDKETYVYGPDVKVAVSGYFNNISTDASSSFSTAINIGGLGYSTGNITPSSSYTGWSANVGLAGIGGNNSTSIGVAGIGTKHNYITIASRSAGGYFQATKNNNWRNYGVIGTAESATDRTTGGKFTARGTDGFIIGIEATSPPGNPTSYAGLFTGNVYVDGDITATGSISDSTVKQNNGVISNALFLVQQLNPRIFTYKSAQYPYLNFPPGNHYGFTAQEIEPVIPELVKEITIPERLDTGGNTVAPSITLSVVNYTEIIPVAIAAIQELSAQVSRQDSVIQRQDSLIQSMNSQLLQCCSQPSLRMGGDDPDNSSDTKSKGNNNDQQDKGEINRQEVELSSPLWGDNRGAAIILYQNVPNPFSGTTAIKYFIPASIKGEVVMIFSDEPGNTLKTVEIVQRGAGTVEVQPKELTAGIYTYSIAVDGNIIDTKKMVYQK